MTRPGGGVADSPSRATTGQGRVVAGLGITQILAWGSTYYLPAVLAAPIAAETGWPLAGIVGGLSLALLVAGLVSPWVGRRIERRGGRPVLAASAVLLAAGLLGLATAPSFAVYLAAWGVIGLGMGSGLYDAAFATLGRLYGERARPAITNLTLFGGFASTVCWPLSALLVQHLGWRGTCLAYAGLQLAVCLPLHLLVLRGASGGAARTPAAHPPAAPPVGLLHPLFLLLAAILTLSWVVQGVVSVHLLTLLQARGAELATAVALGALIGPAQVGARLVEKLLGQRFHPLWTLLASALLVTTGLGLLAAGLPILALCLVTYAAGVGISSIARGTVPLALFGPSGYAVLMGRLGAPMMIAAALAPALGALLIGHVGPLGTPAWLAAAAACNLLLVLLLFRLAGLQAMPRRLAASRNRAVPSGDRRMAWRKSSIR